MTWFRVDDSFPENEKTQALEDEPSLWSDAIALWLYAGCKSSAGTTDGFVRDCRIGRVTPLPVERERAAAEALVECGLWDRAEGGYLFHDWPDYNPTKEELAEGKRRNAKKQRRWRIRQRRVKALIERDGLQCMYCDAPITSKAEIDLVTPEAKGGVEALTNMVLACRTCLESKRELTLSKWVGSGYPGAPRLVTNRLRNRLRDGLVDRPVDGLPTGNETGNVTGGVTRSRNRPPTRPDPTRPVEREGAHSPPELEGGPLGADEQEVLKRLCDRQPLQSVASPALARDLWSAAGQRAKPLPEVLEDVDYVAKQARAAQHSGKIFDAAERLLVIVGRPRKRTVSEGDPTPSAVASEEDTDDWYAKHTGASR